MTTADALGQAPVPQPFGRDGDLVALATFLRDGQWWRDGRLVSSSCPSQAEICTALGWPPPHDPAWAAMPTPPPCPTCDHRQHGQPCNEHVMREDRYGPVPCGCKAPAPATLEEAGTAALCTTGGNTVKPDNLPTTCTLE